MTVISLHALHQVTTLGIARISPCVTTFFNRVSRSTRKTSPFFGWGRHGDSNLNLHFPLLVDATSKQIAPFVDTNRSFGDFSLNPGLKNAHVQALNRIIKFKQLS